MINGKQRVEFAVLQWIEMSKWDFTLTGSRYFGTKSPVSDWDFFVEYDPDLEKELVDNNWESVVCSHANIVIVYEKDNVHIQLVHNASARAVN